jgi:CBS domain-containing protein
MKLNTLSLEGALASELMMPNPISIRASAGLPDVARLLHEKGISAAPVIDAAGRPIGVISRSDLLVHQRVCDETRQHSYFAAADPNLLVESDEDEAAPLTVADLMTPAVFAVAPETPARKVVADMIGYQVHRLFVVDDDGVLIGVISSMDILKHLHG